MKADFQILRQPFDEDEKRMIFLLCDRIEKAKSKIRLISDSEWQAGLERLAPLRRQGSSSLKRKDSPEWLQANQLIDNYIGDEKMPVWSNICEINAILNGSLPDLVVRSTEIFVGPYQACPLEQLSSELDFFKNEVLPNNMNHSVLVHAAVCQYVLVSLHPFKDGNGRTATMLSDWILALNDYLPISFTNKADSVVMYQPGRPTVITPGRAAIRVLQNVLNSYACFNLPA